MTRPNPPVGAVIVRQGRVVGQGWHRRAGAPHAEVVALTEAGRDARGATLYVTLEPCSTYGRTPPCTQAICRSGIQRVVVGCQDPNPKHRGRGLRQLRKCGLEVVCGVCREEARGLIEPFGKWVKTGRPWLTLKLAMSLDGRIADYKGASRWITGLEARREVHELRRSADAIMIGAGTALRDDPSLLPRPALGRKPYRVVLDSKGRLPASLKIFSDGKADRTFVMTSRSSPAAWKKRIEGTGAQVIEVPAGGGGLNLVDVLNRLGKMGLLHVLCEGGGKLAAALVRCRLVDRLVMYYGPMILGEQAVPSFRLPGMELEKAPRLRLENCARAGDGWRVEMRPY